MPLSQQRKYICRTDGCENAGHETVVAAASVGVPPLFVSWPKPVCPKCHNEPALVENEVGDRTDA